MTRKKRGISEVINKWFYDGLRYIKKSSNYIWAAVGIFLLMGLFGFFFPMFFENTILGMLRELLNQTKGLGISGLISFIFTNNLQSAFLALVLGLFFGLFSISMLVINGYVLGFVMNKTVINDGYFVLWKLLPHGIFEIPAIMISAGLGIAFGFRFLHKIHKTYFKKEIPFASFVFFGILFLPFSLLAIALLFSFFLYYDYIIYYLHKGCYTFLILSILMPPIMHFNIIFNKKLRTKWNEDYSNSLKAFVFIIIPILLIASIIEGFLIYLVN